MCTLLFYREALGRGTIALAGNRDEHPARPWTPPDVENVDGTPALFPRDHKGGTWLGTNGRLLAALTNMAPPGGEGVRSRGLLVRDTLSAATVAGAHEHVAALLAADAYDGFNLLLADPAAACVLTWNGGALEAAELPPGVHLLRHRVHGSAEPADPRLAPSAEDARAPERFLRGVASRALSRHGDGPPGCESSCRHGDSFATRSSCLVFLDPRAPDRSFFLLAAGPPCESEFQPHPVPSPPETAAE